MADIKGLYLHHNARDGKGGEKGVVTRIPIFHLVGKRGEEENNSSNVCKLETAQFFPQKKENRGERATSTNSLRGAKKRKQFNGVILLFFRFSIDGEREALTEREKKGIESDSSHIPSRKKEEKKGEVGTAMCLGKG